MGCSTGNSLENPSLTKKTKSLNLASLDTNCKIISGHSDSISQLLILNDGRLCSSSWDGTIKLWNKDNFLTCDETIINPKKESFLCFIEFNNFILAGDSEFTIFQYDLNSNNENIEKNEKNENESSYSNEVINTRKPIHKYINHSDAIYSLLQLNNIEFASCSEDTFINIWELNKYKEEKIKLSGHKGKVNKIILLNNNFLASCSNDCSIKIWEYQLKRCHNTLDSESCCMDIIQLNNGKIMASYFNKDLKIWDFKNHRVIQLYHNHQNYISFLFEYKENKVLSCTYDGEVEFWDVSNGEKKQEGERKRWHLGNVSSVILFKDNFISGGYDNLIKIW